MSEYPDMKAPDHQPPILTGDCRIDMERAAAWSDPDLVRARQEVAEVWEREKANRQAERAERLNQERTAAALAAEIDARNIVDLAEVGV
jgi:hypothetical protein